MSARKLGRFASLVVVLAAIFTAGAGAVQGHAVHKAIAAPVQELEIIWT